MKKYRTKRIKKISVPGWKEDKYPTSELERRYVKIVKGDDISYINIWPSLVGERISVIISGRIFSIPGRDFKTDVQANAYAKRVMLHINKQIKEFGI